MAWRSSIEGWNEAVEGRKESIENRKLQLKAGMNVSKNCAKKTGMGSRQEMPRTREARQDAL
jgi:hypothetical protein